MRSWGTVAVRPRRRIFGLRSHYTVVPMQSWPDASFSRPLRSSRYAEQAIDIDMSGEMLRKFVQRFINQRIIGNRCLACRKAFEPCRALSILGKQAVDVGTHDASVRRNGPLRGSVGDARESPRAVRPLGQAHMHFISRERHAVARYPTYGLQALLRSQNRLDVE